MNDNLKTLPLYADLSEHDRLLRDARRILDQRAQFVRAFKKLEGRPNAPYIDPVLRFHLGLEEGK